MREDKPGGGGETGREWARAAHDDVVDFAQKVADTVRGPLLVLDPDLRVLFANDAFCETFKVDREGTEGRLVYELGNHQWDIPALRRLLEEVLPNDERFEDYRVEHEFEDIGRRVMVLNARRIDHVQLILLAIEDTTERESSAEALREIDVRRRLLQAAWQTDPTGVVTGDSPSWCAYTGQTLEEWLGYGWLDAIHPEDRAYAEQQWREAVAAHRPVDAEFRLRAPDGGWRWTNVLAAPVLDANGEIEKWAGMNIDIDVRKRAEAALRESRERQAFLLRLSDALRAEADADAVANRAIRMLAEHMRLDRCYITLYRPADDEAVFPYQVGNDTVPSLPEDSPVGFSRSVRTGAPQDLRGRRRFRTVRPFGS